ncbi:MAG: hypothetical protein QM813_14490 [Verrucomicrobiota bacterium]
MASWLVPVAASAGNRVVSWGGDFQLTNAPAAATNVIAVAAGNSVSLALKADGTLLAWGYTGVTNVPAGLSNVVAIAAGDGQCLALKNDGTLAAWGAPTYTTTTTNIPTGLSNLVAIACGDHHNLVLRADGKVFAWGANYSGQTNIPVNLSNVVAIAAGNTGNLAIRANGTAWGSGTFTNRLTGFSNLVTGTLVASGNYSSAALRGDGSALIWGYPNNTTTNLPNVIALVGRSSFNQAGALWALRRDGTLVGFGTNYLGVPNVYQKLTNVLSIAIGYGHHVAIVGDSFPLPLAPLTRASFSNRTFTIQQPTVRGRSYVMEYRDAATTNDWQQLPPVPGTGQTNALIDSAAYVQRPLLSGARQSVSDPDFKSQI